MTIKGEQHHQQEEITIDTPTPQEITPPPEAIVASQTPVETNEVAIPVTAEQIEEDTAVGSDDGLPKLCTVIAPSTLDEGYSFPAQVDGIDFVVTVPKGGIQQGQAFQVPYPTQPKDSNETSNRQIEPLEIEQSIRAQSITGDNDSIRHWRAPFCECCEVCSNGLCCYGFFCTAIVLAQVMTRLHLNAIGTQASGELYKQTFWWVLAFWIAFLILFCAFVTFDVVWFVVLLIWAIYFAIAGTNVRSTMRRKYGIQTECCKCCDGVFDDFCTSLWCSCCSTIQMVRQTHDVKKYPYQCCTKTGLNSEAPEIV